MTRPPELPRRFRLWPHQWLGIPLLLAIPVLAVSGVFDPAKQEALGASDLLELRVEFPKRMRYGASEDIRLSVRNKSGHALRDVRVDLDENFLKEFSGVEVVPHPEKAYSVRLTGLAADEVQRVSIALEGKGYGTHEGTFTAAAGEGGEGPAAVKVRSFVFP